jgi:hypothetical protein
MLEQAWRGAVLLIPRPLGATGEKSRRPEGQGLRQPAASWVTLRFIQERLHFMAQGGQISFENSPNHLIRNESVAMD